MKKNPSAAVSNVPTIEGFFVSVFSQKAIALYFVDVFDIFSVPTNPK